MADVQTCRECGVEKPLDADQFYRDGSRKSGFHIRCKPCYSRWMRQVQDPARQRTYNRRSHERKRVWAISLKDKPCADCGGTFPPYVMDFDHVRGVKTANVAELLWGNVSKDIVLAEIAKCELVCANCHRIRTHSREVASGAA